jgi:flagellar protein FliS
MAPIGYSVYNNVEVQATDNKEKILLMLLDGAIRFTKFARMGMERKNPKLKGENISKVIAIISELDCALDRNIEAEFIGRLSDLYQYMMGRLTHANYYNEPEPLKEVEGLLTTIHEGFEGANQQRRQEMLNQHNDTGHGISLSA